MAQDYWRPILAPLHDLPKSAEPLAGGSCGFATLQRLARTGQKEIVPLREAPQEVLENLTKPRPPICGTDLREATIMGILNVTPDSFSDGGRHEGTETALAHARSMVAEGAQIIDIGGESTRPGADPVDPSDEADRVLPVIQGLKGDGTVHLSIDTRNASTAESAIFSGADLFNDVSALTHDPLSANVAASTGVAVCLMHAQGDPETMQNDPSYDNVLLDVFDALDALCQRAVDAGVDKSRIIIDPGIGFGKTLDHNLMILNGLSLFHCLGSPLLVGASRKSFIGKISGVAEPSERMPGSLAVALHAATQGAQILRVHDVAQTAQALAVWKAIFNPTPL